MRERWRGLDWLGQVQLALALGALVVLGAVLGDVAGALAGSPVAVAVPLAVLETGEMSLPPGTSPADGGTIDLVLDHPTTMQQLDSLLGTLPGKLVVAAALALLAAAVRAARRERPFAPPVARLVHVAAVVLLVGGVLAALAPTLSSLLLTGSLGTDDVAVTVAVQPLWLLPGAVALAAAQVLRRGETGQAGSR